MAVLREFRPLAVRRGRCQGVACLGLLSIGLWWAAGPAPREPSAADGVAFAGLVAVKGSALAPPATRGPAARAAGRDWKPGNVAKKQDFRAAAAKAAAAGGKKKKGGAKQEVVKEQPKIYRQSPIIYNGKQVATINGTIAEYKVDIWSGAHPIWQGKKGKVLLDASSVTKFQERFGFAAEVFGTTGLEQLEMNKKLKKEQEEREKLGLKAY
mmetsp:Transcript_68520/g.203851  ORF Transcript_68520/g.203851 Transcript_68520/m.203851 type:complete len:211 (+) Transcript_68520:58-690(+)